MIKENLSCGELLRLAKRDITILDTVSFNNHIPDRTPVCCYHLASAIRNLLCLCIVAEGGNYSHNSSIHGLYDHYLIYCKTSVMNLGTFCHVLDHWIATAQSELEMGSAAEDSLNIGRHIYNDLYLIAKQSGYIKEV